MRARPNVDVNNASISIPLVYCESSFPVRLASDSPMEERGMSVHPVKVSRDPGSLPFHKESPCRVRIRVCIGSTGGGFVRLTVSCTNEIIVRNSTSDDVDVRQRVFDGCCSDRNAIMATKSGEDGNICQ